MSHFPHDAIVVRPGQDLAAVVAALPNNSRVYLADGVHSVSSEILISGKTGISIEGGPNALIQSTTPSPSGVITITGSTDVTLRGFRIDNAGPGGVLYLIKIDGSRIKLLNLRLSIANGFASGRGVGIMGNLDDCLIRNCSFSGADLDTAILYSAGTVTRLRVVNNYCTSTLNNVCAFITLTATDSIVSGNNVVFSGTNRMSLAGLTSCTRCIVRGNTVLGGTAVLGSTGGGVGLQSCTACIVEGNTMRNVLAALTMTSCTDCIVRNNTVDTTQSWAMALSLNNRTVVTGNVIRNGGTLGTLDAIRVYDENNLILSANILDTTGRYGILFTGATGHSNIDCIGNEIRATANDAIIAALVPCTRFVVSNNIISANVAGDAINFTAVALTDSVVKGNQIASAPANGINFTSAARVNVQDNKIACAVVGVKLTTCSFCTVANNGVDSSGSTPAFIDGCSDLVLSGNRFATATNVDSIYLPNANIRLVINGNKLISTGGGGVNAATLTYSIIRTNQITGAAVGITLAAGCNNNNVSGNEIISPISNGITNAGQYVNINGNRIVGSGNHGIQTTNGDCLIGGNHVTGCAGDGIRLDGGGGAISRVNCNGNYVSGCTGNGINMIDCDESMVQGNRSYGNTGWGILQDAASDQDLVSSNHVRGNTAGALSLSGTNLTSVNNKT